MFKGCLCEYILVECFMNPTPACIFAVRSFSDSDLGRIFRSGAPILGTLLLGFSHSDGLCAVRCAIRGAVVVYNGGFRTFGVVSKKTLPLTIEQVGLCMLLPPMELLPVHYAWACLHWSPERHASRETGYSRRRRYALWSHYGFECG